MSAFVVDNAHVDVLLKGGFALVNAGRIQGHRLSWFTEDPNEVGQDQAYSTRRQLSFDNADAVGRMLQQENVAGVCACYEDDTADQYEWALEYRYSDPCFCPTPQEILKAVSCYEYQACEHEGWEASEAHAFCVALSNEMQNLLMPEDAPWEWTRESIESRRIQGSVATREP